ncbi:MAG: hypothetical protein HYR96_12975 [Deltaproteobacteria bacterium]|nr:hypothetical protein [Deltaproteobacteria bacterium]MBI3293916.1 hypothetical protein [Deltaproteobacteria bacterium]
MWKLSVIFAVAMGLNAMAWDLGDLGNVLPKAPRASNGETCADFNGTWVATAGACHSEKEQTITITANCSMVQIKEVPTFFLVIGMEQSMGITSGLGDLGVSTTHVSWAPSWNKDKSVLTTHVTLSSRMLKAIDGEAKAGVGTIEAKLDGDKLVVTATGEGKTETCTLTRK